MTVESESDSDVFEYTIFVNALNEPQEVFDGKMNVKDLPLGLRFFYFKIPSSKTIIISGFS